MSKVVVTGGAGFIGKHLVKRLKDGGYEVEIVDIALDPNRDVRKVETLLPVFKDADTVFHLAALPSVPYSVNHPEETHETNLTGTVNVLVAARDTGVKRVIFSSSAAVYGDQEVLPIRENVEKKPISPYAMQKLASEMYLRHFAEVHGLETVSLRYFNVYGEGQDPNGPYASAVPKFLNMRREGKILTIVGDGEQTRDFVHVSDVVDANIAAAKGERVGKGEGINIATGKSASINYVASLIGGEIEYIPPRLEIKNSLADISLAKDLLDWEPKITLAEGIKELLK